MKEGWCTPGKNGLFDHFELQKEASTLKFVSEGEKNDGTKNGKREI